MPAHASSAYKDAISSIESKDIELDSSEVHGGLKYVVNTALQGKSTSKKQKGKGAGIEGLRQGSESRVVESKGSSIINDHNSQNMSPIKLTIPEGLSD